MEEIKKPNLEKETVTLLLAVHNEYHWPSRSTYSTHTHEFYIISGDTRLRTHQRGSTPGCVG